jgi:DNA-binding NtrC family response regulator
MFLVLLILFWHICIFKITRKKYSLLIIDDKMPKINGLFLTAKLLEINPKLNVIIMEWQKRGIAKLYDNMIVNSKIKERT